MMSNDQLSVIFHIGMPRAGSTSLQLNLFNRESLFIQYGEPNAPKQPWHQGGLGIPIAPDGDEGIDIVREGMIKAHKKAPGKSFVISDESFLSVNTRLSDQELFARRIKSLGFSSKVLIVIRRQEDIAVSRYRQLQTIKAWSVLGFPFLKSLPVPELFKERVGEIGYPKSLLKMPSFSEWLDMGLSGVYANWFSNLFYDRVYEAYARILGSENVVVVPYEMYKNDIDTFSRGLSDLVGVSYEDVIGSLSGRKWNQSSDRKWERVFTPAKRNGLGVANSFSLFFDKLIGRGGFVPDLGDEQKQIVEEIFGGSNKRMESLSSLNLREFGYAVR